jgi:hypothetical protein
MILGRDEAQITRGKALERRLFLSLVLQGTPSVARPHKRGEELKVTRRRIILIAVLIAVLVGGLVTATETGRSGSSTVQQAGGDIGWGGQP